MITLSGGCECQFLIDEKIAKFLLNSSATIRLAERIGERVERQEVIPQTPLSHSRPSSKSTAWHAIPSPRPIAPSCSVVVALTLMQSRGASSEEAMRTHIASLWGASLGNCATTVISAFDRAKLRAVTSA